MPRSSTEPRIRIDVLLEPSDARSALHDATFWSLRETPKELPAVWLYDERGSRLFDEITRLPEYYLTRCEREILRRHAPEIARRTGARTLVELGSGTAEKTRLLLDALTAAATLERFVPLDVSAATLEVSAHAIVAAYPSLGVHALVADFERDLDRLPPGERRLVAFLGSTIGNLAPSRRARFLTAVAAALGPEDAFLLGIDLVKDPARLEAAYGDTAGVTEAFVRNGLVAVNRVLGATFDQERLEFGSRWDPAAEWVDIGFRARAAHVVTIRELEVDLALAEGEWLRFEISAKFRRARIERELDEAGLRLDAWWTDTAGDFALLLASRPQG
jgi:L-histidine Nalpha-methyltransferase